MGKVIGAAEFKKHCLRILDEVHATGEPVTITKRGLPVGVLRPPATPAGRPSILGAMAGTVLRYDGPFDPAVDPDDWDAVRGDWEPNR